MPHKNRLLDGHTSSPEDRECIFDVSTEQTQGDLFMGSDSPVKQQVQNILSWEEISPKAEHIPENTREAIAEACAMACIAGSQTNWGLPYASNFESSSESQHDEEAKDQSGVEKTLLTQIVKQIMLSALTVVEKYPDTFYKRFEISKWNGKTRTIESPNGPKAFLKLETDKGLEEAYIAFRKLSQLRREKYNDIEYDIYKWLDGDEEYTSRNDPYLKLYYKLSGIFLIPTDPINVVAAAQKLALCGLGTSWLSDSVCGFRPGSGAYEGLRRTLNGLQHLKHKKIKSVYQIDIRNFFPSISYDMAKEGLVHAMHQSGSTYHLPKDTLEHAASGIARISWIDNRLTQGSHTSPMVANLYAQYAFDKKILKIIRNYSRSSRAWRAHNNKTTTQLEYARYADDIVIFSSHTIPEDIRAKIDEAIEESSLQIAPEKKSYLTNKRVYTVWGASIPSEAWDAGNYRFMPPKKIQENVCRYTFETLKLLKERNIKSWGDLQSQSEFKKMVGYYSHAHHVGFFGDIHTLWKKTRQYYAFSKELVHAWEAVLTQYHDILPEHFQKYIFVVGRDDSTPLKSRFLLTRPLIRP